MFLDYSKIEFDQNGRPEVPELVLQTLSKKTIGVIPDVSDLRFNIKFSEPSEISFSIPNKNNGLAQSIHESVKGNKLINTKSNGI